MLSRVTVKQKLLILVNVRFIVFFFLKNAKTNSHTLQPVESNSKRYLSKWLIWFSSVVDNIHMHFIHSLLCAKKIKIKRLNVCIKIMFITLIVVQRRCKLKISKDLLLLYGASYTHECIPGWLDEALNVWSEHSKSQWMHICIIILGN